jgi:outer membrane protein assembly factor BamB
VSLSPNSRKPLRIWPGVIAAVLLCLLRVILPIVEPEAILFSAMGGFACAVVIVLWWLFFSRAAWLERLGALVLMGVALYVTFPFVDVSIRMGMNGRMFPIYAIFALTPALVAWAVITRRRSDRMRRASMVATIVAACGVFLLLRTGGIKNYTSELTWRWAKTPEARLLAQANDDPPTVAPSPTAAEFSKELPSVTAVGQPKAARPAPASAGTSTAVRAAPNKEPDWPGFRGPNRDGIVRGVRIETDWSKSPPIELWRRPIGPGWSSFAVDGDLLFTQEQRGNDELVACYRVSTGKPVWRHRDAVRFWESNGGAGPRATPTVSHGRVYAFGATGILNVLDAGSGALVWSRDVAADSATKIPTWGFSSSPLIADDLVIVAASSKLVAYDLTGGKPRWVGSPRRGSYSSPHLATIDGVVQILLQSAAGVASVAPATGTVLWEHPFGEGTTIVQPALVADGDIVISSITGTGGLGIRRIAVAHAPGGWTVDERWTSAALKPYFNDFVVHNGHAFGFDGSILACVDLADGTRTWKGGRYGNGQLVLLSAQDALLVLSEDGELALVEATTDQFRELARFPAIEGKTWNHPVVVGDVLLVRNGEEMAAFRLPLAGQK